MITTSLLLIVFLSGLVLVCLLVLLALASQRRNRIGYLILLFSFLAWSGSLYTLPDAPGGGWFFVLPLVWLILIFSYGFPRSSTHAFPASPDEPRDTQESLRGTAGRREALSFYFVILLVSLLFSLMFLSLLRADRLLYSSTSVDIIVF